jgi:hypothetical protein
VSLAFLVRRFMEKRRKKKMEEADEDLGDLNFS